MQKTSKLLWSGIAGIAAIMCAGAVNAATRSTVGNADAGRAATTSARMPTMPTMSINTVGTHAVSGAGMSTGSGNGTAIPTGGGVTPTPNPNPTPTPTPTPDSDCPDGGVRNSSFTVDMCMQSVLRCVQSGVLPHGLNDLFNEDLRHSIFNGMGICASEVDKCIREVRVDCQNVYLNAQDVWLDFNSRIVQPEYYNFVLRKTGLTPNQAENVCELLDKNTYGRSFAAVSASGGVTSEYNNTVGAYNEQGGGNLSKPWPQGPTVNNTANGNTDGVDGERGHYARWDATEGVCKIRVAAYNKDDLITNKWLFGALGDDRAAEVWQDAGSTFTCNKDLFDFSLLNNTRSVAVVGIGGGTALGAGIGALAGRGAHEFDCSDDYVVGQLKKQIFDNKLEGTLNKYLSSSISGGSFGSAQCNDIKALYNAYETRVKAVEMCVADTQLCEYRKDNAVVKMGCDGLKFMQIPEIVDGDGLYSMTYGNDEIKVDATTKSTLEACKQRCVKYNSLIQPCRYKTLLNGGQSISDALCDGTSGDCVSEGEMKRQINDLDSVFAKLSVLHGTESKKGQGALIGAGIGAATGGVATAITAFVERNNISCRVGDGLNTVGFGKSFTIDSLKDFYVKWNLRVADSIRPTERVTTCDQWRNVCAMYTTPTECQNVEVYYQVPNRSTTTLIRGACVVEEGTGNCVENEPVLRSYGVTPCTGGNGGGTNPNDPFGPVVPFDPNANHEIEVIQH